MDFPDPEPGPGEVVLEMKASGMCGSDLHFYRAAEGAKSLGLELVDGPMIAGHEPCGVIVARGADVPEDRLATGERVMCHHYSGCGICSSCRSGWQQLCSKGFVVYGATAHGAHAPYMCVPADTLVRLPEALSFSEGAAISCGTGTAFRALKRMNLTGRDTIAVFGQGPVGLSVVRLAAEMGARVIAVELSQERREMARTFLDGRAIVQVRDSGELSRRLKELLGNAAAREELGNNASRILRDNRGAVGRTVRFLGEYLGPN